MGGDQTVLDVLECVHDAVVVVDPSGDVTDVYGATEDVLGHDEASLLGTGAFEHVHSDDEERVRAIFDRAVAAEEPLEETVTHRFRRPDDEWVWLESRIVDCPADDVDGYVVCSQEVTERVSTERQCDRLGERLDEIAATVGDAVWMYSGDWSELLFVNDAYEDVFGHSVESLREEPTSFLEAIHPEDRSRAEAAMERVAAGEPLELEFRADPTRDYTTHVHVEAEPVEEDGSVQRIVGFSRDVTDRRRRERQLAVMDNLLRHNIRNDMSLVLGHADAIESEGGPAVARRAREIHEQAQALVESAEKQREIIDLLTKPARRVTLDVAASVADAVAIVRDRYPQATVDERLPDRAEARALPEIQQAVVELVENAVRHAPDDAPTVAVSVEAAGGGAVIQIRDDCPPIPEEELPVLTGDREMDDIYHSTGLGLWLVYWIVDLSGGNVEFEREDDGNVVRLWFTRE